MNRPAIPIDVERKLHYESMGHCMSPQCEINFFENNCSEKAHIVSFADSKDNSYENLILLCANCHTKIDRSLDTNEKNKLIEWKKDRMEIIDRYFSTKYASFDNLKESVVPILKENQYIFQTCGPNTNKTENHSLWKKFELDVIANNRKLELILSKNKNLLHQSNQQIVDLFIWHSKEFIKTRNEDNINRINLFPTELLSIFGLEEVCHHLENNVSALQNFIKYLIKEKRFRTLNLTDSLPVLTYLDNKKQQIYLNLNDEPNVKQIFFNGIFYRPKNSSLRLDSLIFFLKWLEKNNIKYKFHEFSDLSRIKLNNKYEVKLFYEYCASISCLTEVGFNELLCVNLYNWNDGQFSSEAQQYAKKVNMKTFNQNEFFIFAHQNIK